ncbi:MAG TPA: hypothetical protein VFI53_16610 [Myxococcaceae bacterium]|nr:hypothetical protein [Myxococcaceae bacterium]
MNVAIQVVVPAAAVLMLFALGLTLDGEQLSRPPVAAWARRAALRRRGEPVGQGAIGSG